MKARLFLILLAMLALASPVFAQVADAASNDSDVAMWSAVAAGFSMAIASAACGLAQAKAVAACAEGMARNPGASGAIRFALILGLALIESLALYTLVIIFAKI